MCNDVFDPYHKELIDPNPLALTRLLLLRLRLRRCELHLELVHHLLLFVTLRKGVLELLYLSFEFLHV